MDSALLVARAAAGDLESFGQLYDAYFNRVYDFAWRVTRDPAAAAEVARGTFERAARALPEVAASGDFGAWALLDAAGAALPRAESRIRAIRPPSHEEAFGTFDAGDPCLVHDARLIGGDAALGCTVWEAATTLAPRDYAVLDLHMRQGLSPTALAATLGVPRSNAGAALERLQHAANESILAYVLARRGVASCERLRQVLAESGFPRFDDDVRRAIDAHAEACDVCRASRLLPAAPLDILRAFAPVQAPFALKGEAWRGIASAWPRRAAPGAGIATESLAAGRAARSASVMPPGAAPAAVLDPGFGGGGPGDLRSAAMGYGDDGRRNAAWFIAAAVGMLAVAFIVGGVAVGAFGLGGGGGGSSVANTGTSTPASVETPGPSPTLGVHVDTPTPAPSPSPTTVPTETPTAPPAPTQAPASPTPVRATPIRPTPTRTPALPVRTPTPRPPTPGGPPTPTPKPGATPAA